MTRQALPPFQLELPEGLAPAPDEPGAFRGLAGEVLRLAVAPLPEGGPEAQQALHRDRLAQGAVKELQRDVCQPDLEVFLPLAHAPGQGGLQVWNLLARSASGRLLAQAVVAGPGGVMKLVLEGRYTRSTLARWFALLESIQPA